VFADAPATTACWAAIAPPCPLGSAGIPLIAPFIYLFLASSTLEISLLIFSLSD